jgi:hypothetical protein
MLILNFRLFQVLSQNQQSHFGALNGSVAFATKCSSKYAISASYPQKADGTAFAKLVVQTNHKQPFP